MEVDDVRREGDVGVNANYLSQPSNYVISSGLTIRFTDAVVISRNRATDATVYPNFRAFSLVLAWPQFIPFLTPVKFDVFLISLCTNVPIAVRPHRRLSDIQPFPSIL